ncbi:hypothetical protein CHS0354_012488 [Potamilus streckersoni]|uniref:Tripartite motif-containing protein 2 n=1 Tax=Potamilus streckersoni TaxID=2493646 RepID=A0AAE0S026_9BIVA|nr:hypothetical protein CHS0354_012488 [Potamilus streckersoni]
MYRAYLKSNPLLHRERLQLDVLDKTNMVDKPRNDPSHTYEEETDNCTLCFKKFIEPKILPCFHSFCRRCLDIYAEKHVRNEKFPCPLCLMECNLPPTGVGDLQTNFYIKAAQTRASKVANTKCDTCEEGFRAERSCIECDQSLCDNCSKTHLKMTSSANHHLVALGEKQERKKFLVSKAFCDRHSSDELTFYCRRCDVPVCLRCKVTIHENHPTEDLSDSASETRRDLDELLQSAKTSLPNLHNYLQEVSHYEETLEKTHSKIKHDIEKQTKKLHEAVDALSRKILEEISDEFSVENARMQNRRSIIKKTAKSLSLQLQSAAQVVSYGSDPDITRNRYILTKQLQGIAKRKPERELAKLNIDFKPSDMKNGPIEEMFGLLTKTRYPAETVQIEEYSSFVVDESFKVVSSICPTPDGKAWVASGWTTDVHLLYRHGLKIRTHVLDKTIDCIAIDETQDLYMTSSDQRMIGRPGPGFSLEKFKMLPGYHPRGITTTQNGEILVCLTQSLAFQDYKPSHKNKVMKLNDKGEVVEEYGADGKLFMYPLRLAVNVNGDICVTDCQKKCVFILKSDGTVKSIYEGMNSTEVEKEFEPRGIACDSRGHILVADSANHAIHLLDHNGQYMQLLLTESEGLFGPYALATDADDCLWVGGRDAALKVFKCTWS